MTWNQSTVTAAVGKFSASAARKAADMSQTTSATRVGLPPCSDKKARNAAMPSLPLPGVTNSSGLSAASRSMNTVTYVWPRLAVRRGHGPDAAEIEAGDGLVDVEEQDTPKPLVGDTDDLRGGGDRHFTHQRQRGLFEQQGEAAVRTRPGHASDTQHPVIGAIGARDAGGDEGVLEEV